MDGRRIRLLGTVALIALVALAGCSGASNDVGAPPGGDAGGADGARPGGGSGGGAALGSFYAEDGQRVLIREADLRLRVDNFTRTFRRARAVALSHGGYVGERSMNARGDWQAGSLTVRVPAENFSAARDDLTALGHVENEDVSVRDFTQQHRDRESRIEQLEREERELQRLLNETSNVSEARQIRGDLAEIREQIRSLRSDQQSLERREALSTISLDMREPVSERPPENYRSAFGFEDAFLKAFYGGLTAAKYVIVFFGYAIPIGLALLPLGAFGIGLVLGWRRIRAVVERLLARDGAGASIGNPQVRDAPVTDADREAAGPTGADDPDGEDCSGN
ncbi:DUF4349 domain-containing protein [Halomicrobium urmianum]|uniref:DUF4349 domain-containing protein n=1 Tax=Halomicrobium urmianum TaxID=1586233 RepID=UPI001CD9B368|nr:DUF4349 domain-containing protein [Halomicrobium urmianum]